MYQARQTVWGALPRRQRRLRRSSMKAQRNTAALVLPTLCCAIALIAYLGVAQLY